MNTVTELLLPAALAFIMFSLGLTLEPEDFRRVFARPRAIAAGLMNVSAILFVIGLRRLGKAPSCVTG